MWPCFEDSDPSLISVWFIRVPSTVPVDIHRWLLCSTDEVQEELWTLEASCLALRLLLALGAIYQSQIASSELEQWLASRTYQVHCINLANKLHCLCLNSWTHYLALVHPCDCDVLRLNLPCIFWHHLFFVSLTKLKDVGPCLQWSISHHWLL